MTRVFEDLSRSLVAFEQDSTLVCVVEMSQSSWLVASLAPGVARRPLKKLDPDAEALGKLVERWRGESERAVGRPIARVVVAYEAGRDGFWLARWLRARGLEAYVMHAASIAVSQEHRRPKTDRLDTQLLMRSLLGWLRGEADHCKMCQIPTEQEEDARRAGREREALMKDRTRLVNRMKSILTLAGVRGFNPALAKAKAALAAVRTPGGEPLGVNAMAELERQMERLALVRVQIKALASGRAERVAANPSAQARVMIEQLSQVFGLGVETAELLTVEVFVRALRDQRAVARFVGLTGSPNESGGRRREKGLARSGSSRVRHHLIQLAWRLVRFQPDCELVQWFARRTAGAPAKVRKTMIVALARKLVIALWRMATTGVIPDGLRLHPAVEAAAA